MSNNEILSIDDQTLVSIMNKRHRSAAKSFKSPPQPKFCIKETLSDGSKDVFINVLSYSRIANQLSEFDPIPLYGGIQIRSYSAIKNSLHIQQTSPQLPPTQLIFAVMASPEVLKKTGRNCPDTPEQANLVELMCEFVEAMNPGLTLSKKPEILKDRDLTGELKDIWSAVQNFREKEKSGVSDIVVYTEFGPESASPVSPTQKSMDENSIESLMSTDTDTSLNVELNTQDKTGQEMKRISIPERKSVDSAISNESQPTQPKVTSLECEKVAIDKLSLSDNNKKSSKTSNTTNINNENESSEKIVKVQNQKNKESQHHFLPKFLTSSKVKEDTTKDKDKEKNDEQDTTTTTTTTKVKTKKSLNFFRRNKSSTASPTHNSSDSSTNGNNNITD